MRDKALTGERRSGSHSNVGSRVPSTVRPRQRRRTRAQRFSTIMARSLLVLLFLAGITCSILPWGRAFVRTTLLLPTLLTAQEAVPLQFSGEPIRHRQTTLPSRNGTVYLDIYAPTSPAPLLVQARNGVLLLPGVGDQRQVPQLVNFAQALARSGIVTVMMTTTTLLNNDVSPLDSDAVVQAFQMLSRLPDVQGQRAGIISFSAGVPLVALGAADPRIRDSVAYLAAFGGYFNTESALRVMGQRSITYDGKSEKWQPVAYPLQVLSNVITSAFPHSDQSRIRQAFAPGGTLLTTREVSQLSPAAQAAYKLLAGTEPDNVDANLAALPAEIHTKLLALSPSNILNEIRAPVFLLHDRNDHFLPFTESRAFAAALARNGHEHEYVEFEIFDHVEVKSELAIPQILNDGTRLFGMLHRVLLLGSL